MHSLMAVLLAISLTTGAEVRAIRNEPPVRLESCSARLSDGAAGVLDLWVEETILEPHGRRSERALTFSVELAARESLTFGSGQRVWQSVRPNPPTIAPSYNWAGQLVCSGSSAHIFVLRTWINQIDLLAYRLDVSGLVPVEKVRLKTEADRDREVKRPTASLAQFTHYAGDQVGNLWGFSVEPEGSGLTVRLIYDQEQDHTFDLRLELAGREFKTIPPKRQDYGVQLSAAEQADLSCPRVGREVAAFTLRRSELSSPRANLSPEEAALLTLSRRTAAGGEELVWASSRLVGRGQHSDWIASGAAWCSSELIVVFELRTSNDLFGVSAYEIGLSAEAIGSLPAADEVSWKFVSKYWSANPEKLFTEREPSLAESVRGLKVGERNGKPFIELMHDPPERHLYDLTYDPAMNRFEKVPVGSGGPL